MNSTDKIKLIGASIAVGPITILKDINWTVKANEHWLITGNCGTGKTVLAEALGQKHRVVCGTLFFPFLEKDNLYSAQRKAIQMVSFMDTSKLFRSVNAVHYYQQRFNAFDSEGYLTVRQYLEDGGFDINQHHGLLATIGIDDLLDLERIKLSSGQTRKMLLAKVMLHRPKILIMDNPYIGLDHGSRKVLNDLLDGLVDQTDITLILSGHHLGLPTSISHRLHIHENGVIEKRLISQYTSSHVSESINKKALKSIKTYFKKNIHPDNYKDIIRFENVNIRYGNKQILKNITWKVKQGEKWAVIGQNGSGKSTLLSLIYADNPQAYANEIYLFDKRRGQGESIWEIKRRIGFTSPELHAYFHENLTAMEVVLTGLTDTFKTPKNPWPDQLDFVKLLFGYFGLESEMETRFNQLSTGFQRLMLFMRALVKAAPVLLLDEPFQGMDDSMVFRCKYLIENVMDESRTLLFISHFENELPVCATHKLSLKN